MLFLRKNHLAFFDFQVNIIGYRIDFTLFYYPSFLLKVNKASKDLELFMRKDPPVLTMDEMRQSAGTIDK